jgi:hypothetical protein
MTRDEHLQWAKARALAYLDRGELQNAITSMLSDLSKNEDLAKSAQLLGGLGLMIAMGDDVEEARRFIQGFN